MTNTATLIILILAGVGIALIWIAIVLNHQLRAAEREMEDTRERMKVVGAEAQRAREREQDAVRRYNQTLAKLKERDETVEGLTQALVCTVPKRKRRA